MKVGFLIIYQVVFLCSMLIFRRFFLAIWNNFWNLNLIMCTLTLIFAQMFVNLNVFYLKMICQNLNYFFIYKIFIVYFKSYFDCFLSQEAYFLPFRTCLHNVTRQEVYFLLWTCLYNVTISSWKINLRYFIMIKQQFQNNRYLWEIFIYHRFIII